MHVCETFGQFGAGLQAAPLPPEVMHHAKRAVVDWAGALVSGAVCAPATLMDQALADDLDRGGARLALGRAATVRAAALINGTAAHTTEVDDIYREAIYHPGAPTIAAALAQAQALHRSGDALLRAVVAGYEVSTRIGRALGRAHYRYWHNTGTVGTFGAAAAAASLLGLPPARFTHALTTCATFAAGLQQAFRMDSMSKPLHAGRAAEGGVLAAQLAASGVTGSLDVLEGEFGMGRAMGDNPDWQAVLGDLGQVYNVQAMTFKNHTCCGHTFAAIDGALHLQHTHGLAWDAIDTVDVATYRPALEVAGNPAPTTAAEARFSLPFVVATALRHGSVRLAAFTPERLADAELRGLMARVRLAVHPQLDASFPGQRAAQVRITMQGGTQWEHLQPTRRGDPDAPLSDAELGEKFTELVAPVLGAPRSAVLLQRLWALETVDDLAGLVPA